MNDPIIRLVDVFKSFDGRHVIAGVSMDIQRGQTTAIIGPSGTGKSVLIKHMVGLLTPDRGQVWVGDVDMAQARPRQLAEVRKRFGMMFQGGALFDSLSAGDNVAFPLRYHTRLTRDERRAVAEEKLKMVELPEVYDRPTSELSGGMCKRVALARAIVMEPEVVVFDEPNSGLDPVTSDTIDRLIVRMKRELGITFVVITHDIISAVNIADHIGMLHQGELVEFAPTEAFIHSEVEVVQRFLHRNLSHSP